MSDQVFTDDHVKHIRAGTMVLTVGVPVTDEEECELDEYDYPLVTSESSWLD